MRRSFLAAAVLTSITGLAIVQAPVGGLLPPPPAERCQSAPAGTATAADWLKRAAARVLPASLDGKVLRLRATHDVQFWEQSDRPYEPYIPNSSETVRWFDAATNVEARQPSSRAVTHAQFPSQIFTTTASFAGRDTLIVPSPAMYPFAASYRRLNPWSVLTEWQAHAADARIAERCVYRDYSRIVLARGNERLFLSEDDAVPVKLERTEPHYLFGQVKAAYVWTTWWSVRGGGFYPFAAFLQYDGVTYQRVGVAAGSLQLIPADSAPRLTAPPVAAMNEKLSIDAPATDTVRVDDHTFLLVTPAYTETVTLQRDTVFLLDATSGESRARQDSAWISSLFPGPHAITVVVTDLAWPHISSVRFWVARGAMIVSHRLSEDMIRRVTDRRWTLAPDALEGVRRTARLRFRPVNDSLRLAGGAIVVHALHGTATEGALAVWMPGSRFLWAGDYIQNDPASPYYVDVVRTVRALRLQPVKTGSQHTPLLTWNDVDRRVPADSKH